MIEYSSKIIKKIVIFPLYTSLWGRKTHGVDCGEKAAQWIRKYLKTDEEFHLIYFAPEIEKGSVKKDIWSSGVYQFTGKDGVDKVCLMVRRSSIIICHEHKSISTLKAYLCT